MILFFKVAKSPEEGEPDNPVRNMDNYARSIRIWNEINPNLSPPASIQEITINGKKFIGWVCPYVEGVQASDAEISQKLIDIYNKTGRIIVDATAKNNFLKTPSGNIVCIDIGMAVKLESRDESKLHGLKRQSSFASLEAWDKMVDAYSEWFSTEPKNIQSPQTIQTIKALLFIKQHRPDLSNIQFLQHGGQELSILAQAFDLEHPNPNAPLPTKEQISEGINTAERLLIAQQDLDLEAIKEYCRVKLSAVLTPDNSPTKLSA